MPDTIPTTLLQDGQAAIPRWLILLLAASCGLVVANLYYAQPLIGPISAELGLSSQAAGLIVTMAQVGYGLGLLLVVPLGDLIENRRLILVLLGASAVALAATALSTHAVPFLAAALCIGIGAVAAQVLVPYASHMAPEAIRGQVVGNVMSGLLLGIMLARPVASFIASATSWHVVFVVSAVAMAGLAVVLRLAIPRRMPQSPVAYGALLRSMGGLVRHTPVLRQRGLYQACLFGAFSLFWTTVPLLLAERFHLSQVGIALFALAGVAGAIAAPIAGRVADRGWSKPATGIAMLAGAMAFILSWLGTPGSGWALAALVAAAILLDFGVSANVVLGQRAIYVLGAAYRSRLNGLYMAMFFAGGAIGSAVGGWAYATGGWPRASLVGLAMPVLGLLYYATEWTRRSPGMPAAR